MYISPTLHLVLYISQHPPCIVHTLTLAILFLQQSMYKSLLDIFTERQLELLRSKMWWVADPSKPYLLKYATDNDFALLELTDLRSLWVARIHIKTLLEEKAKYAKSLQVNSNKDLLTLFESLLSTTDTDPRTEYIFKEAQAGEMHFTFKKMIKIFDFNWTYKLKKINCNPIDLICRELLTPLASALKAQTNHLERVKRRFEHLEKDYLRKMNEMERSMYRSPLLEDQQEWQQLIPKHEEGTLLTLYQPDVFTQFVFSSLVQTDKKFEKEPSLPVYSQHSHKPMNLMQEDDHFGLADSVLSLQLEQERQRQKKERKIDFI